MTSQYDQPTKMKASRIVIALAAATFPSVEVGAVHVIEGNALQGAGEEVKERGLIPEEQQRARMLSHVKIEFDECVGKHIDWCKEQIWADHLNHPDHYGNAPTMQIQQTKPKKPTDADYPMIGLRTNMEGTAVTGITGDGMIWYPYQWVLPAGDYPGVTYTEDTAIDIGPWDCDVGTPLSVEECCNLIKLTVPAADINGNSIDCYPSYPIGSAMDPVQENRVIILTNHRDFVMRAPVNE